MEQIPVIKMKENARIEDILVIYNLAIRLGLGNYFAGVKLQIPEKLRAEFLQENIQQLFDCLRAGLESNSNNPLLNIKEQRFIGAKGCYKLNYSERRAGLKNWLQQESTRDPFDPKRSLREYERNFWEKMDEMANTDASVDYASDIPGQVFPPILGDVLSLYNSLHKKPLKGVTTPMFYMGGFRSCFAYHQEDQDLGAANLLIYGTPKHWYFINAKDISKLRVFMRKAFPEEECPQRMRHKTFFVRPEILRQNGIRVHETVQKVGELVLTFPGGAHSGFNYGLNCATAWNHAGPECWPFLLEATLCGCGGNPIDLEPKKLLGEYLQKQGRGKAWEEYMENKGEKPDEMYHYFWLPPCQPIDEEAPNPAAPYPKGDRLARFHTRKFPTQEKLEENLQIYLHVMKAVRQGEVTPYEASEQLKGNLQFVFELSEEDDDDDDDEYAIAISEDQMNRQRYGPARGPQRTIQLPEWIAPYIRYKGKFYNYKNHYEAMNRIYYSCRKKNCIPNCLHDIIVSPINVPNKYRVIM